jgi:hypothetical protein
MSDFEIYGIAYNSTVILQQLVSARKYTPIGLHVTMASAQIKSEVEDKIKRNKNLPVVLAGSLQVARTFLRNFPTLECKLILCECPPFLDPPACPVLQWLDCDLQAAGAWQVAKIKPEDFMDLLDVLNPLSTAGKEYIASVRYIDEDRGRIEKLQKFGESIPKYYKDTIAALEPDSNKSPLKTLKNIRKAKEGLKSLLAGTLETVDEYHRAVLAKLVLDYQITLVTKREYLSKLTSLIEDETVRKDFLTLRKWMDSKKGALLQEAFFAYSKLETKEMLVILEAHKKVSEEDLQLLVVHFDQSKII